MKQGFVQVYTGNGKGKTTAALGLALRAAGAGLKIYIGQFIKGMHYSELNSLAQYSNIDLEQYGQGCFIYNEPTQEDITLAQKGLARARSLLCAPNCLYDMVILDEINIAIHLKLLAIDEVIKLINDKNPAVELILTGRYAPSEVIQLADLVTEMQEIKHYYQKGIEARSGIEK